MGQEKNHTGCPQKASEMVGISLQTSEGRKEVGDLLHSRRFIDKVLVTVWAEHLDKGCYLCSPWTMCHILAKHQEVRERRHQHRHSPNVKPELLARDLNQCWGWDSKKPVKWSFYSLFVVLNIDSRYVVGWIVTIVENSVLAKTLVGESYLKQGIEAGWLTLHENRELSMKSKALALLLADLGVTKSHSRLHVHADNSYSNPNSRRSSTVLISPTDSVQFKIVEILTRDSLLGITNNTVTRNRTTHTRGRPLPRGGAKTPGTGSGLAGRLSSITSTLSQRKTPSSDLARGGLDQPSKQEYF